MTDTDAKPNEKPKGQQKERGKRMRGVDALSVDANQLVGLLAKELQKVSEIKPPTWAKFVKTGAHKERPPAQDGWWYMRTASVLRTVARLGPVGTSKLQTKYGGKHSRGHKSERFAKGSGSILRKALQQLEKAGLVKQGAKGIHKGRVVTKKAAELMGAIALKLVKGTKGTEAKGEASKGSETKASAAAATSAAAKQ